MAMPSNRLAMDEVEKKAWIIFCSMLANRNPESCAYVEEGHLTTEEERCSRGLSWTESFEE